MDIIRLYQDFSVDFKTEGHKHCRPGWVNTPCPHCTGNEGYHLGYNVGGDFYTCWRCGWHPITPTVSKLIRLDETKTRAIVKKYGLLISSIVKPPEKQAGKKPHLLPSHTMPLASNHRRYLEKRNFDPDQLERTWRLVGTGPVSTLDEIDYKHRIVFPFVWNDVQVSFDSRDITGKVKNKYQACPLDREIVPHKAILYGKQEEWTKTGICVEGPTDVWRLGINAFATSGIKYTPLQVRVIAKTFRRVPVVFDDDPQAKIQATKLVAELKFRGVDAFRIDIVGDPGAMDQSEADYLVKQLMR